MLPDLVFFNEQEYTKFKTGKLGIGEKICVGFNSCDQAILKVLEVLEEEYLMESSLDKSRKLVNFDLEKMNNELFLRTQKRWVFYRLL